MPPNYTSTLGQLALQLKANHLAQQQAYNNQMRANDSGEDHNLGAPEAAVVDKLVSDKLHVRDLGASFEHQDNLADKAFRNHLLLKQATSSPIDEEMRAAKLADIQSRTVGRGALMTDRVEDNQRDRDKMVQRDTQDRANFHLKSAMGQAGLDQKQTSAILDYYSKLGIEVPITSTGVAAPGGVPVERSTTLPTMADVPPAHTEGQTPAAPSKAAPQQSSPQPAAAPNPVTRDVGTVAPQNPNQGPAIGSGARGDISKTLAHMEASRPTWDSAIKALAGTKDEDYSLKNGGTSILGMNIPSFTDTINRSKIIGDPNNEGTQRRGAADAQVNGVVSAYLKDMSGLTVTDVERQNIRAQLAIFGQSIFQGNKAQQTAALNKLNEIRESVVSSNRQLLSTGHHPAAGASLYTVGEGGDFAAAGGGAQASAPQMAPKKPSPAAKVPNDHKARVMKYMASHPDVDLEDAVDAVDNGND